MNLILTSDFPASAPRQVLDRMRATAPAPRVAWVAGTTEGQEAAFAAARERFGELGFGELEACDVDEAPDPVQLAYLHEFDIIYLHGDDPIRLRYNVLRSGLSGRLRQAAAMGRLVVTAGAGSLILTPNVSLYRLRAEPLGAVMASWGRFDGTGAVAYEVLPHLNRWGAAFLDAVRRYSERVDHDIIGVPDGGALFHIGPHTFDYIGEVMRYRNGTVERHGRVPLA